MKRFLPIVLALAAPAFVACTSTDTDRSDTNMEFTDGMIPAEFDLPIEGMT